MDGDLGTAWIAAGVVKVAFAFHVEFDLVREIELIADPDVLATLDVRKSRRQQPYTVKGTCNFENNDM